MSVAVPFHPSCYIPEVDLSTELLNELFSFQDNEHIVKKIFQTRRDDFTFDIFQHAVVRCKIGDKCTISASMPTKNRSKVSIASVYDVYGLELASAFLRNLFTRVDSARWIVTYLIAYMFILEDREDIRPTMQNLNCNESFLAIRILNIFIELYSGQPKLAEKLSCSNI